MVVRFSIIIYSSWLVYGENELTLRCLVKGQKYYLQIEAFNAAGISKVSETIIIE